ncbi:MAG: hypothetical protein IJI25_06695 [Eubacterium sp.]|nr:hypothetical protein [Eubacterium sp.]
MFAYTLLITTAYKETEEQNVRLTERALAAERIAELSESVSALLSNMPAMTFSKDVKTGRYLAYGYTDLFYVDLKNRDFIKYKPSDEDGSLTELRHGEV